MFPSFVKDEYSALPSSQRLGITHEPISKRISCLLHLYITILAISMVYITGIPSTVREFTWAPTS